jgi:cytochrome P450
MEARMADLQVTALGKRLDLTENPLPSYAELRALGSLIPNDGVLPEGLGKWVATTWDSNMTVFRDHQLFSSANSESFLGGPAPLPPLEVDPPDHRRYRRLLDPFFTPKRLQPLGPSLRAQVNTLIDRFIDVGEVDLVAELFIPYPTQVFLTLYGLPEDDRPQFLQWKDAMIRGRYSDPDGEKKAITDFYAYMKSYLAQARGGDDLLSELLASDLSEEEILSISHLFLLAGLDTVTSALTGAFAYLARHPEDRQLIVDDPELIPDAVEELLRIETPAPALFRRVTRDTELDGVQLREGDTIFCHLGAANGDDTSVPEAERVDFKRSRSRHASFGLGPHRCLGSHLARLELRLVLEEFHRRIPTYELASDVDVVRVPFFEGLDRLPIVFPAGGR